MFEQKATKVTKKSLTTEITEYTEKSEESVDENGRPAYAQALRQGTREGLTMAQDGFFD